MSRQKQMLGAFGEAYARAHLTRRGYRIVASNVRLPSGEIDIVAQDGDCLVVIEVRTRRGDRFGSPEESITPAKAQRLVSLGHEYLESSGCPDARWRIDVVALEVDRAGNVSRAEVIQNAVGE
ncbi:MAG: YraN family protein [Chloroflexi bacterium]|nr:YraN family protein [Chloroflexota bacterium]